VTRATVAQLRHTLAEAAQIGPFFRLEILDDDAASGWRPVADAVAGLVASTAVQLATDDVRVAASILHQGLAARLWSAVLGCGLLAGVVPDLGSLVVTAKPPISLGVTDPAGWTVTGTQQLASLSLQIVDGQLTALRGALPARLADGLLRGNSASAMVGALSMVVRARPSHAEAAVALCRVLLSCADLAGAGVLADHGLGFRRRSCCLYYRVPGGGLCGDCCFATAPAGGMETPGRGRA
jgi:hypothetical protein